MKHNIRRTRVKILVSTVVFFHRHNHLYMHKERITQNQWTNIEAVVARQRNLIWFNGRPVGWFTFTMPCGWAGSNFAQTELTETSIILLHTTLSTNEVHCVECIPVRRHFPARPAMQGSSQIRTHNNSLTVLWSIIYVGLQWPTTVFLIFPQQTTIFFPFYALLTL